MNGNGNLAGVNFFFVLSGFLITYLILTEINRKGKLDVWRFYIRRALRIWPLYLGVIILILLAFPDPFGSNETGGSPSMWHYFGFVANLDHVYNALPGNSTLGVQWSVCVEEQFYLAWPLFFLIFKKKILPYLFAVIIIISWVFNLIHVEDELHQYYHTFSCMNDLAIGGLVAFAALNERFIRFAKSIKKPAIVFIYVLGFAIIFGRSVLNEIDFFKSIYRVPTAVFFAFVLLEQNYSDHSFYKMGRWRVITYLGRYTYGLYLLHMIAITVVAFGFNKLGLERSLPWFYGGLVAALGLSIGIAALSYHFFEAPFLKLKKRFALIRSGG